MVGAAGTHPHVEQGFGVVGLQRLDHLAVLCAGEGQAVPVGAPDQAPDVHSADVSLRQQALDLGFRVVGQALVGVAAPIGEVDCVAGSGLPDALRQLREVGGAVHQRPDEVAAGPGLLPEVAGVEHGLRVTALRLGQQPLRGIHRALSPRSVHDQPALHPPRGRSDLAREVPTAHCVHATPTRSV